MEPGQRIGFDDFGGFGRMGMLGRGRDSTMNEALARPRAEAGLARSVSATDATVSRMSDHEGYTQR